MYWAIRSYEIAIEEGIKFFVYGNLDYGLKKSETQARRGQERGRCGDGHRFSLRFRSSHTSRVVDGAPNRSFVDPGSPPSPPTPSYMR